MCDNEQPRVIFNSGDTQIHYPPTVPLHMYNELLEKYSKAADKMVEMSERYAALIETMGRIKSEPTIIREG